MPRLMQLDTPANFSFRHTVNSHGWSDLPPFETDEAGSFLGYIIRDSQSKKASSITVSENGMALQVCISGDGADASKVLRDVRHILRLDDDLEDFYATVRKQSEMAWIAKVQAGRMLRSATVFEDLVKTICTTNCSWGLTKKMVTNMVEMLGEPAGNGKRAFPTAESLASWSEQFYRDEIRAGYRSPYFVELAENVASGKLLPEEWLHSDLPTAELKKELKKVKGVGDYAAENLLKLLGRYDGLALDSWLRSQFYKKHNAEKICADKKIEKHYKNYGPWKGLAMWCDMTERWFDGKP